MTAENDKINKTFTVEKHLQARPRIITKSSKKTTTRPEDEEGFEENENDEATVKAVLRHTKAKSLIDGWEAHTTAAQRTIEAIECYLSRFFLSLLEIWR